MSDIKLVIGINAVLRTDGKRMWVEVNEEYRQFMRDVTPKENTPAPTTLLIEEKND